jgi:hypothetical protein
LFRKRHAAGYNEFPGPFGRHGLPKEKYGVAAARKRRPALSTLEGRVLYLWHMEEQCAAVARRCVSCSSCSGRDVLQGSIKPPRPFWSSHTSKRRNKAPPPLATADLLHKSEREHLTRQPIRRPVRSKDMVGLDALLLTTSAAIKAHFFWLKSSSRTFLAVKRRVSVTQVDEDGFEALVMVGEVLVVDWISLSL